MSVTVTPGQTKTIYAAGLVATKYRVVQTDGTTVVLGPVTTGISNIGTARYSAAATFSIAEGVYEIQWDDGSGAWATTEDLNVGPASVADPTTHQLAPIG